MSLRAARRVISPLRNVTVLPAYPLSSYVLASARLRPRTASLGEVGYCSCDPARAQHLPHASPLALLSVDTLVPPLSESASVPVPPSLISPGPAVCHDSRHQERALLIADAAGLWPHRPIRRPRSQPGGARAPLLSDPAAAAAAELHRREESSSFPVTAIPAPAKPPGGAACSPSLSIPVTAATAPAA